MVHWQHKKCWQNAANVGKMKSIDERNVLNIVNKNESQASQLVMHWQISVKLASAAPYDELPYKAITIIITLTSKSSLERSVSTDPTMPQKRLNTKLSNK